MSRVKLVYGKNHPGIYRVHGEVLDAFIAFKSEYPSTYFVLVLRMGRQLLLLISHAEICNLHDKDGLP
jgi:hypothetical protein